MSWTISFTLYLWWLFAYLAVGGVLLLPLTWGLNRHVTPRQTVTKTLRRHWRRVPLWVAVWPVSVWTLAECEASNTRRRRRRAVSYPQASNASEVTP